MATTQVEVSTPSGLKVFKETDLGGTSVAVKASSGTIYAIVVDNTANAAEATYLKMWDAASGAVTVGTTAPDWVIKIPAATKRSFVPPEGLAFGTALTTACVTTAGTAGTTSPTADVVVNIIYA